MKYIRILLLALTLLLLLCACRYHGPADFTAVKSPTAFAISKDKLANPPQDPKGQKYSRLNQPLHLIPRELLQTPSDQWIEYLQPEGIGVFYLYSYDAGKSVNTYVVYLDIISQTIFPSQGFTTELGEEHTFYTAQQRIQISPGFIGAIQWEKASDTLSVWENPPYHPVVQITSIQADKKNEEIGTVLTEWIYGGSVKEPLHSLTNRIPGTNIIADIVRRLTVDEPYDALNRISYAIIRNPEENGAITEWQDSDQLHFTDRKAEVQGGHVSFHGNYLTQSNFYGNIGLGGICLYPNGTLTDTAHRVFMECTFSGTNIQLGEHLNWRIDISLSMER